MATNSFGIDINPVCGDMSALIISVDSSKFTSLKQRDKTFAHVRKMTQFIDVPVLVIDRNTTVVEALNDEQLAELGLQRVST